MTLPCPICDHVHEGAVLCGAPIPVLQALASGQPVLAFADEAFCNCRVDQIKPTPIPDTLRAVCEHSTRLYSNGLTWCSDCGAIRWENSDKWILPRCAA